MLRNDSVCGKCKEAKVQDCYHCPYCGDLNCELHCYMSDDGDHGSNSEGDICSICNQIMSENSYPKRARSK